MAGGAPTRTSDGRVLTLLNDPEWRQWSDREISRRCGVDGKTSHVYDKRAMHICSDLVALFEKLNSADWPDPDNAMDAWMTDRSDGPSPDEVQFAADWLAEFAALFRTHEPRRLKAVQAMLDRAKEITNGTH
jgi:hypothetical protein